VSTPFARTLRSLEADAFRPSLIGMLLVAALLLAWLAWFVLAEVSVYAVSQTARLEADIASHPIDAPALGRIVSTRLLLGREVEAGEVLVELDADAQRLQLEEERSRLAGIGPQIDAVGAEIAAEERGLGEERGAGSAALAEARARSREAEAVAGIADQESQRAQSPHHAGSVSDLDLLRVKGEAERRRAAAESLRLAVSRSEREQQTRASDRQARIESLRRESARLTGLKATTASAIQRLSNEIERRSIRAPIAGRLGEVAELRAGAVVEEGAKLGAIVPSGKLRVVGEFLPPDAIGRIRPGQKARLRLEGFPWMQYGSLEAGVSSVGSEVRDGRVRVELAISEDPSSRIPVQHGLPGSVEVEVERVSPAALVLRAAGRLVAR